MVSLAQERALRQKAEAARTSLRAIFESVPGSYIVLTPDDDYRIVGATEAYLRATRTERADIVDRKLFDVFLDDPGASHEDSARRLLASLQRVRETGKSDVVGVQPYPIRRPDEEGGGFEERYWSLVNAPVPGPHGQLAYIVHRVEDVTEFVRNSNVADLRDMADHLPHDRALQMEAEVVLRSQELQHANEKLREGERRYRRLIECLPAAIYTCDAEGRVSLYNEAAVALWGREPEIGKELWCGSWRIRRPDGSHLPLNECPMAVAIRERRAVEGEVVIERPDGARRYIRAHATPVFDGDDRLTGAINLLVDDTDKRKSEEADAHLAAIVESSHDAIVSKSLDGIVQSWNTGAERILGYTAGEMVGQHIRRIVPPDRQGEEGKILETLRRGERIDHYETVRLHKDGHRIDVSLTISPVLNSDGQVIGASKIARDITEQKAIAEKLREADRRKDEFLAMLAHELRNPLAAVSSAVELLGMPDGAERLESVREIIGRQTGLLVRLVDDLLDISRITRGVVNLRKDITDVAVAVDRAVQTVTPLMDSRRHRLRVSIEGRPLCLRGDPTRLEQIIVNLLTNAARYTEPGGRIRLSAIRNSDSIQVSVRDNGIGISPELLPKVFDLFAQSERSPDRAAGGLGIGLTLVKSLVEMHGGTVEAKSDGAGCGSEFIMRLPAVASSTDRARPPPPAMSAMNGAARKVLLVDDNRDAAQLLADVLGAAGHTVELLHEGAAAIDAAAELQPDAVLLDIGLPGLDGYEIARRVRSNPRLRDVTLIAISGYCQEEDRQRSREAGFDHHLAKPPDHGALLALLAQCADGG